MTRIAAAALVVLAFASYSRVARAQPAAIGVQDADVPIEEDNLRDTVLPYAPYAPTSPPPCCCQHLLPAPGDPTENELTGLIVAGATVAAVSYLFATIYIVDQPHSVPLVDSIPVIGTIIAAQRHVIDDRTTPLLLFSAGVQAIGILAAAMAGAELAARHRLVVDFAASPWGVTGGVTIRY